MASFGSSTTEEVPLEWTVIELEGGSFHVFPLRDDLLKGNKASRPKKTVAPQPMPQANATGASSTWSRNTSATLTPGHAATAGQINGNKPLQFGSNKPYEFFGPMVAQASGNKAYQFTGNRENQANDSMMCFFTSSTSDPAASNGPDLEEQIPEQFPSCEIVDNLSPAPFLEESPEQIDGHRPRQTNGNQAGRDAPDSNQQPKTWNVCHTFVSSAGSAITNAHQFGWVAVLNTKTTDLLKLMQDGFHWSDDNQVREDGHFTRRADQIEPSFHKWGFTCARYYTLKDKSENPIWSATLSVAARELRVLASFEIRKLTVDHIAKVVAWNQKERPVYFFAADDETVNFNAVCDDKELKGVWPRLSL